MKAKRLAVTAVLSLSLALLSACSSGSKDSAVKLQGAGASFPAPLYLKWFKTYGAAHPNVQVDYQSVGSGSGVKSFIDKTVDFAASDAAMSPDEIAKVNGGVQLVPMTAGAIVLAYNLPNVSNLQLSREAYADIFLGKVTKWNDPIIAKENPNVKLPDQAINVVVRADGSGTSYVFTKHLSAISPEFQQKVGVDKAPNWPVGTKSKGNEGVTASIKTTPGSIGYIEYGYAKSQDMPMVALENKSGAYVAPTPDSAKAALASAQLPDNMIVWVSDPDGATSYPIVTFTWMCFYKQYPDKGKLDALKALAIYGLTDGQKDADALGYVPLPDTIASKGQAAINAL